MINDKYYNRRYVISGIAVVVVLVYIIKLFVVQIIDQSTKEKADNNALVRQTVYPSRGLIYDRNGVLLVFNQPMYDVTMIMREMGNDFDTLGFCEVLKIDKSEFDSRIADISNKRKNRGFSRYTPQVFMAQLNRADVAPLQEAMYKFPGIALRKRTLRDYAYSSAAHALGSVGEVSLKDIESDDYYVPGIRANLKATLRPLPVPK